MNFFSNMRRKYKALAYFFYTSREKFPGDGKRACPGYCPEQALSLIFVGWLTSY